MKRFYILLLFISINTYLHAQNLRSLIIYADLIVTGKSNWNNSKLEKDYSDFIYDFNIKEIIKGKHESKHLKYICADIFIQSIDEETEILFLKNDGKQYNLVGHYINNDNTPIKEMLKIIKINDNEKRLSSTLEWSLNILESGVYHNQFMEYLEINEFEPFFKYYKELGYFNSVDSVFSFEQKTRILNRLLKIKHWDITEREFASLIYKDFSQDIEQYILKMIKDYFIYDESFNISKMENMLIILKGGRSADSIKNLIEKIEKYIDDKQILINSVNEFEKILNPQ